MIIGKRFFALLIVLLTVTSILAQMSDRQVTDELKRLSTSGKSQEQIFTELASRGVTMDQLQRIKARYESGSMKQSETNQSQTQSEESRERLPLINFPDPAQWAAIKESRQKRAERVFGESTFSNPNLTFQPNMNLPTLKHTSSGQVTRFL